MSTHLENVSTHFENALTQLENVSTHLVNVWKFNHPKKMICFRVFKKRCLTECVGNVHIAPLHMCHKKSKANHIRTIETNAAKDDKIIKK